MKNLKLNIFFLIIIPALLTCYFGCNLLKFDESALIFTGNLEKEFLGVSWGCSFKDLQKILDESPFPIKFKDVEINCPFSRTTYTYEGNNRLPEAKYSVFFFIDGKLQNIMVVFFRKSETDAKYLFYKLKERLKKEFDMAKLDLDLVIGIKDKDKDQNLSWIHGSNEEISFDLRYGGDFNYASNSVILEAHGPRILSNK